MTRIGPVVPAILTDSPTSLDTMVRQSETFTDYVQFDVMDGKFVPSRSITGEHLANLPMKLEWEVHLMVLQPEDYLPYFQREGAIRVIFHYEATSSPRKVIFMAQELGLKVGLAVNPETPISAVLPLIDDVDNVLLMSVHPGFYGAPFIPEVLDKVRELRKLQPDIEIGIDGGVKESNIARIAQSGANVIYVGSAIFLQPQPDESFRRLQLLAQQAHEAAPD